MNIVFFEESFTTWENAHDAILSEKTKYKTQFYVIHTYIAERLESITSMEK